MPEIFGEVEKILSAGEYLGSIGVHNWALDLDQVQDAALKLMRINAVILGGDVLYKIDGGFKYSCDNWFIERVVDENPDAYLLRAYEESVNYMTSCVCDTGFGCYYTLVAKSVM